jgi:hypothetical protein
MRKLQLITMKFSEHKINEANSEWIVPLLGKTKEIQYSRKRALHITTDGLAYSQEMSLLPHGKIVSKKGISCIPTMTSFSTSHTSLVGVLANHTMGTTTHKNYTSLNFVKQSCHK